jgi:hypothetical protein
MRFALLLWLLIGACSSGDDSFPGYRELVLEDYQAPGSETVHTWLVSGPVADAAAPLPFEIRVGSQLVVAGDGNRLERLQIVARAELGPGEGRSLVVRVLLDDGPERAQGARSYGELSIEDLMGLVQAPATRVELRPRTTVPLVRVAGEQWTLIVL